MQKKPLTEGNSRNVQKGNVKPSSSQTNVRPTAPPPAPKPPPNTNKSNSRSGIKRGA